MNMDKLVLCTAICAGAAMAPGAYAQSMPEVSFSGYGTLGAAVTNNDTAEFRHVANQDRGASNSVGLAQDTRAGLQANVKFNDMFSAVGQVLASRYQAKDTAHVEWLYGQARLTSWLDIKAGRMVLPVFLISDSRNVGYASHWLRAPGDVYGTYPLSYFDGAQAQLRTNAWNTNFSLQLSTGKSKGKVYSGPFEFVQKMDDIRSLNLVAEHGDWTLRYGRMVGTQFVTGTGLPAIKEVFSGLGLQYDNGQLIVMSEYVTRRGEFGGISDNDGAYVSAGWRVGSWTPYGTLSHAKLKGAGYAPLGAKPTSTSPAVGLRWDAMKNVAVKTQVERTDSAVSFVRQSIPYDYPKTTVYSLAVDFVF